MLSMTQQLTAIHTAKTWNAVIKNGSWLAGAGTAGGCRNYPTFVKNPQFIIDLEEDDDGDGKCSCLVAVMQKNRRKQRKMGVQDLCIGFSVYKVCTNKHLSFCIIPLCILLFHTLPFHILPFHILPFHILPF